VVDAEIERYTRQVITQVPYGPGGLQPDGNGQSNGFVIAIDAEIAGQTLQMITQVPYGPGGLQPDGNGQ
jgi:hypothetical protein